MKISIVKDDGKYITEDEISDIALKALSLCDVLKLDGEYYEIKNIAFEGVYSEKSENTISIWLGDKKEL